MLVCHARYPRLQGLDSQGELIAKITDSISGMAKVRQELQGLGENPEAAPVQACLQRVPCLTPCRQDLFEQALQTHRPKITELRLNPSLRHSRNTSALLST